MGGGRARGSHASRHAPPGGGGGHYARRPPASWDHNHHVVGSGAPSSLSDSTSSVYYLNGYQGIPRSVARPWCVLVRGIAKLTRRARDIILLTQKFIIPLVFTVLFPCVAIASLFNNLTSYHVTMPYKTCDNFPFAGYDGVPVDEMEGMGIGSHPGSTYGQVNYRNNL